MQFNYNGTSINEINWVVYRFIVSPSTAGLMQCSSFAQSKLLNCLLLLPRTQINKKLPIAKNNFIGDVNVMLLINSEKSPLLLYSCVRCA